jgi:dienelactone hydrolase
MLELVGSGGFGEVYRARDTKLDRIVAIKVLPKVFAVDAERRERFRREAVAASALNHPNICTVHDLVEADGHHLIVMELVEGQTLHERLKAGPLAVAEALPLAIQIADALGEAHRAGILHRDVKCRNIALTKRGQVKVLDFGLAKLLGMEAPPDAQTLEKLTADGTSPGTPGYMSPEQLLAMPLDARSDLFSFGVVLYRMLTGRLPFEGTSSLALSNAILHAEPRDFGDAPITEKLKEIVLKLLRKDPEKRYAGAEEVEAELKGLAEELAPARRAGLSRSAWVGVAAAVVLAVVAGGWLWHRSSRERWAREATSEIRRLFDDEEFAKAAALAKEAREVLPKDPALEKLWAKATAELTVESVPSGGEVSIRPYRGDPEVWESLGRTPVAKIRHAKGIYLLRLTAPGCIPSIRMLQLFEPVAHRLFRLDGEGTIPEGMVRVLEGKLGEIQLDDFLMDRTEVTNADYRVFVDAGGYRKPEFWKQPFVRDGRTLPWDEAVGAFRDSTGQSGPAGWELGRFPAGQEKHPVTGVSWYEAAAYAEFAGKSLPTTHHWTRAAGLFWYEIVVPGSNFAGRGTVPVGSAGAFNHWGTYDMAGNAKEWCWNETKDHQRLILGGGFGDPNYMFRYQDARSGWRREPNFGFRCVKLLSKPPDAAWATVDMLSWRDYSKEKPASDEAFRAFRSLYAYDKRDLAVHLDAKEESETWTTELVSFDAGYGSERVLAYLFLPRNARPPYQTVVYFPGGPVLGSKTKFDLSEDTYANFLPQSGRALLVPVFKGTYQRRDELDDSVATMSACYRDHMIAWAKDLSRSIDFVESRKDLDHENLAFLGFSWGGVTAPVMLAVEGRFRTAILVAGGMDTERYLPEVDPINFVRHVRTPLLLLGGRYDHLLPLESFQLPLLRLLGTPEKDKKHVVLESGHGPPRKDIVRETLAWLDKYLGPVKR